jgi:hypothetical protein
VVGVTEMSHRRDALGRGVSAGELIQRNRRPDIQFSARSLTRWLVESGLAVARDDGRLYVTARGVEVGGGLDWRVG